MAERVDKSCISWADITSSGGMQPTPLRVLLGALPLPYRAHVVRSSHSCACLKRPVSLPTAGPAHTLMLICSQSPAHKPQWACTRLTEEQQPNVHKGKYSICALFVFCCYFCCWEWGLNSGLSACKAGALLLEPNLQSTPVLLCLATLQSPMPRSSSML